MLQAIDVDEGKAVRGWPIHEQVPDMIRSPGGLASKPESISRL
ncbi:MAG: hypothetical protein R3E02_11285 [Blastomonas sp.]